jgi:hypothetical protein
MKSSLQVFLGVLIVISYNLLLIAGMYYLSAWLFGTVPFGKTHKEYGFLHGTLHGIQWSFNFISQLFTDNVSLYAKHNSGFTYWFGYVLGLLGIAGPGTGLNLR